MDAHLASFFAGHPIRHREWPSGPSRTRVPNLDVYEIGPGPRLNLWTYVTSGCWEATAYNELGLEFVLTTTDPNSRHVEIMTMVAYYHAGPQGQRLDHGHTLPIGEPWTRQSLCTYLLVGTPYAYGSQLEICSWPGGHARILALQPITTAERDFKVEHGLEVLEQRLEDTKTAYADPDRPSVV